MKIKIFNLKKFNQLMLILMSLFFVSCLESTTKISLSKKSPLSVLPASVSHVEIKNNRVVISGLKLASVTDFKIQGYSHSFNIIEQSENKLVVEPSSGIELRLDKVLNFILSSANASSTIPVQINLDVPGAQANDFLQFNGTTWQTASINGLQYKGLWDASAGADPVGSPQPGDYFVISHNGNHALNGISSWLKGDWAVYADATIGWQKIENSTGTFNIESLGDVQITAAANNQVLSWNGTKWVNRTFVVPAETDPSVKAYAKTDLPVCGANNVLKSDGVSLSCVVVASVNWSVGGVDTIHLSRIILPGANRVVVSDVNGYPSSSVVTSAELLYLSGVTSNIQTQLNSKLSSFTELDPTVRAFAKSALPVCGTGEVLKSNGTTLSCVADLTGAGAFTGTADKVVITGSGGALTASTLDSSSLTYLSGLSGNVQTQLTGKQATITNATDLSLKSVRVYDADASNYVELKSPNLSANVVLTLPSSDGSANQVLQTDGNGVLSWVDQTAASGGIADGSLTYAKLNLSAGDIPQDRVNGLVTALAGKEPAITAGTTAQYLRGDKTLSTFATDAIASALTGFTVGTNTAIADGDSIMLAFRKVQAQLNSKATGTIVNWSTGGVETLEPTRLNLITGGRVVVTDATTKSPVASNVTTTELGYLAGVTSSIQSQLNSKISSYTETNPGILPFAKVALPACDPGEVLSSDGDNFSCVADNAGAGSFTGTADKVVITGAGGALSTSSLDSSILGYLSGITSSVQTQISGKQPTITNATDLSLKSIRVYDADASNYVEIKSPALSANVILTLPSSDGNANQVLQTDGNGVLSWVDQTAASGGIADGSITYAKLNLSAGDIPQDRVNGLVTALAGKEPAITTGTAAQYIRGNKTLSTFATDAIASALTGFTVGTNTSIADGDSIMLAFRKVQAQLNSKATGTIVDWSTAGVETLEPSRLNLISGSRVVVTDPTTKAPVASSITTTELNYLSGITSSIQSQLTGKQATLTTSSALSVASVTATGDIKTAGRMVASVDGSSTSGAKLEVEGQILSRVKDNGALTAINWNNGNVQYTSANCTAMTFSNMYEGGTYTLIVTGGTSGLCTFSQTVPDSLTNFKFVPGNIATTAGKSTIYTFLRAGSIVYVNWVSGY